jgi:hypothetical protein
MKPYRAAVMTTVLLALAALAPLAARAADLPVSYTVDDKLLKGAVTGTMLTFTLHTDDACATSPVHTEVVPIDDATLTERLKLFRPKGGAMPPKTAEIRHTLMGVDAVGKLFLKVTGTGVTAVGNPCQALASLGVGIPVVKDAAGKTVGVAVIVSCPTISIPAVLRRVGNRTIGPFRIFDGATQSLGALELFYVSTAEPNRNSGETRARNDAHDGTSDGIESSLTRC